MYMAASLCGGSIRGLLNRSVLPWLVSSSDAAAPFTPVLVACAALFVLWLFCYALYRKQVFFKL
jgi:hypothetical protein